MAHRTITRFLVAAAAAVALLLPINLCAYCAAESGEISIALIQLQKGFVDRIHFDPRREVPKHSHYPTRHISIKRIVGRQYLNVVLLDQVLDLKRGFAHLNAQGLGLIRSRYDAAVII